ncbi:MAG TPA: hypothetical protein VML94_04145 [Thermoplasmata archaeon]|nr:hypothetical protein [Thermoplasmata archaeon]
MARVDRPRESRPPASEARAERRARSMEEPLDVRLKAAEPYPLLEVRNPIHRTAYLVMLPEFPSAAPALCTCTDFARRDLGTCKHIEAGVRWLVARPDAKPPPTPHGSARPTGVWLEIDRREKELPPPARLTGRDLARPGEALFA